MLTGNNVSIEATSSGIIGPMKLVGENLTCNRSGRRIFSRLYFEVRSGEVLLITGKNGAGKTSLLRLMTGLSRPETGSIHWDDGDIYCFPERHRQRIAYVGHADALKSVLTVSENLQLWIEIGGITQSKELVDEALSTYGLSDLRDTPVGELSTGQRRRVALSRLLAADSSLWLLDEPTIALDEDAIVILINSINQHRRQGGMAVIATNAPIDIGTERLLDLNRHQGEDFDNRF